MREPGGENSLFSSRTLAERKNAAVRTVPALRIERRRT
jgi:hypothetical protein